MFTEFFKLQQEEKLNQSLANMGKRQQPEKEESETDSEIRWMLDPDGKGPLFSEYPGRKKKVDAGQ